MADAIDLDLEPEVEHRIKQLAGAEADVLITGPTGVGKSKAARRIHDLGARRGKPFVLVNCGAIPAELAESTLFGHKRGAFTHAVKDSDGLVAEADQGTLFLDEIGELPLAMQVKVLTLLQDRRYRPVGSAEERSSSFRLIAATNRDLLDRCNQGLFREDLYHRINVLSLTLRPLRDLPEKALRIAAAEADRLSMPEDRKARVLSLVQRLSRHPAAWPGNVRELLNLMKRWTIDLDEEERRILAEWARWQRPEGPGRLTPFAPSVSPSLADRERYAGMIHELAGGGARPKAAVSRKGSLDLASRLLDVFPSPLPLDDVQTVLGARDPRTVKANIDLLEQHGLVERAGGGIIARWPPATSAIFRLDEGEWTPAGPGEILSIAHGGHLRIQVTSKLAGTLGIMMVTHQAGGAAAPDPIVEGKELFASKPTTIDIALNGAWGLEQILVHAGPVAQRGGSLVAPPTLAGAIMPDSIALERHRRMALERWHEGWLAEHLVFHRRSS